jgi:hypothetical protein
MILGNGNPSLYSAHGRTSVRPAEPVQPPLPPTASERIDQWIGTHPTLCVALALSFGATLGWLLKRK